MKYEPILEKAKPLLIKAERKDFVLHTKMVVRAMEEIQAGEGGDLDILMPAAILHDVGWSEVPKDLQLSKDKNKQYEALLQHIEKGPPLIRKILKDLHYDKEKIDKVIDIVSAHKFTDPEDKDKQLLIDADTLSDTYKESFYSDVEAYGSTPSENLKFRSKNKFYTNTARKIFEKHLSARRREIETGKKSG